MSWTEISLREWKICGGQRRNTSNTLKNNKYCSTVDNLFISICIFPQHFFHSWLLCVFINRLTNLVSLWFVDWIEWIFHTPFNLFFFFGSKEYNPLNHTPIHFPKSLERRKIIRLIRYTWYYFFRKKEWVLGPHVILRFTYVHRKNDACSFFINLSQCRSVRQTYVQHVHQKLLLIGDITTQYTELRSCCIPYQ